jgi:glycosidase
MEQVNRDKVFDYYRASAEPGDVATYYFSYQDGSTTLYLTQAGLTATAEQAFPFDAADFPVFTTPDWVKDGIFYQIFPERFRNGSEANDQTFEEWYYEGKKSLPPGGSTNGEYFHSVEDWYDVAGLTKSPYRTDGKPDYFSFYGGDVQGLREGLDYLEELGITIIYFNPLFEAKSNHKYDCCDFEKIDPHYGTNEEFAAFVEDAHSRGIRIVLDIVYNHSGNCHFAFRDAVEKGKDSPYYDWYEFKRWPLPGGWPNVPREWNAADYYYCWWGFGDLPDLNFDLSKNNDQEKTLRDASKAQVNMALVSYLLDATEYWVKDIGVDGFRLDVPNEVPAWFWTAFRKRVKEANPDAYLVGELWGNAKADVGPHMFDAVMNYAFFRHPVTQFLGHGRGSATEFDATLAAGRTQYPTQAVQAQMNLIDSHDTVRFLTQVGSSEDRLKLAAMFGMTYVGAPHIYYGDEIGMEGGKDPDCRRPFLWNYTEDPERVALLDYYKKLIKLRKDHAALRTGEFESVLIDDKLYGYVRSDGSEEFLVLLNAGRSETSVTLDLARWDGKLEATDQMSGEKSDWTGTAQVALPGGSGRIFRIVR